VALYRCPEGEHVNVVNDALNSASAGKDLFYICTMGVSGTLAPVLSFDTHESLPVVVAPFLFPIKYHQV
jgi:hypothetical protein